MSFFKDPLVPQDALRAAVTDAYHRDEAACVKALLTRLHFSTKLENKIEKTATRLIKQVRKREADKTGIEALLAQYDLSSEEGVMLMCLAEALLRIPDKKTEQLLINDKLTGASWEHHVTLSESSFVKLTTWGLALTGKLLKPQQPGHYFKSLWQQLLKKTSEPVIRQAVREAIRIMSHQFVLGRNINEALRNAEKMRAKGYTYSFDMLGEVARTAEDAQVYFDAYQQAITAIDSQPRDQDVFHHLSISVKLSALFPRYEPNQRERAIPVLIERLKTLARQAKANHLGLTVDAEEADRLDLSLDIFQAVFTDPDLNEWEGFGLAVQAYQKRAYPLLQWLIVLAKQQGKRIPVRLVKGAYWDTEIKRAQVDGFTGYPVFTRKSATDISYLACAKLMLSAQEAIYPQFATHNAYSVAAIVMMAKENGAQYQFEFQNLQGMGQALHDQVVDPEGFNVPCRIYAPVGSHEDLLPYLVRRLLENGANSSFVNQITNPNVPISRLVENPLAKARHWDTIANPNIPLPQAIYGPQRLNSAGLDLSDHQVLCELEQAMQPLLTKQWVFTKAQQRQPIYNPADLHDVVGFVHAMDPANVATALTQAEQAFPAWNALGPMKRAQLLRRIAELLETNCVELMSLAIREAGKVLPDAIAEVREAVDFCRYYAQMAETTLAAMPLPGPTGESNTLRHGGRGVMLCISPWNFPIAIFTGQVVAALVAGNTVIAKPAEQTPLLASRIVALCHEAGVPKAALQLAIGQGEVIGQALIEDSRVSGVLFTGSTATAQHIRKTLASRPGPIVPLVAETGGINAMIADSTALPEQLVNDVLISAFGSAGQRCSALRILLIQDEIADKVIAMLTGAMAELTVGNPAKLHTDIGPVIDATARDELLAHAKMMAGKAQLIAQAAISPEAEQGYFIAPQAFLLQDFSLIEREVFGPMLHVIRYASNDLDAVIDAVNALGYGLTFGIQSRINQTVDYIQRRIKAGNVYVNRNMIGAVVGVQPFGGSRLSGTGPKAGGPHYLARLCAESTLTIDTTAAGGNASLMMLADD